MMWRERGGGRKGGGRKGGKKKGGTFDTTGEEGV